MGYMGNYQNDNDWFHIIPNFWRFFEKLWHQVMVEFTVQSMLPVRFISFGTDTVTPDEFLANLKQKDLREKET